MAKSNLLYRLRYTQVSALALVAALCLVIAVFTIINSRLDEGLSQMRGLVEEASYLTSMQQKELQDLQHKLQLAATDDFIANEARTQYGYLSPGEIRFVVTNPEVLWGLESLPSQQTAP